MSIAIYAHILPKMMRDVHFPLILLRFLVKHATLCQRNPTGREIGLASDKNNAKRNEFHSKDFI